MSVLLFESKTTIEALDKLNKFNHNDLTSLKTYIHYKHLKNIQSNDLLEVAIIMKNKHVINALLLSDKYSTKIKTLLHQNNSLLSRIN